MHYLIKKSKAFTLIELLVVISIIALLLAIIMPSLAQAKRLTRSVFCMNNMRQMAIAANCYTTGNNDYYPLAHHNTFVDGVSHGYAWDFTSHKDWNVSPVKKSVEPGILWGGETLEEVQQCPSFKGNSNWSGDPHTGYNYNTSYIGMDETSTPVISTRSTEVRSPSGTVIFGDGQFSQGANKFMRPPFPAPGGRDASVGGDLMRAAGIQGYRHVGKTNVAFCDGHVQSWKELFTNVRDTAVKEDLENYNETHDVKIGFLSNDNRVYDLK